MGQTLSSMDLLCLHVEAMFTMRDGRLTAINEPWDQTKPAPRLYFGWTVNGSWLFKTRHDLDESAVERITSIATLQAAGAEPDACIPRLFAALNSESHSTEICYHMPNYLPLPDGGLLVTTENIDALPFGTFAWLHDEIATAQPCAVVVVDGQVASLCRSVRISPRAHEAGIETLPAFRGRGLAGAVLAHWADAVREIGCVPLYSTTWDNTASQRVAQKAGLSVFAKGVSLE